MRVWTGIGALDISWSGGAGMELLGDVGGGNRQRPDGSEIGAWFELWKLTRSVDLSLAIKELVSKMADSFGGRDIFSIETPCTMGRELHVASIWRETEKSLTLIILFHTCMQINPYTDTVFCTVYDAPRNFIHIAYCHEIIGSLPRHGTICSSLQPIN